MSSRFRIYIAGPMTGHPQFNIPAFEAAAADLRAAGYDVVSPVEMDSPAVRTAAMASLDGKLGPNDDIAGETWGEILARDVRVVANEIDGVMALPGWSDSRGARLEVFVALLCKKPVFELGQGYVLNGHAVHPQLSVKRIISEIMLSFLEVKDHERQISKC